MNVCLRCFIFLFNILTISSSFGVEININLINLKKFFPAVVTDEVIKQWITEDIATNRRLHQAVEEAEGLGLTKIVLTDLVGTHAATVKNAIVINPFYSLTAPQNDIEQIRTVLRQNLCFELANVLNAQLHQASCNPQQFKNPQEYADAVVLAEANSFSFAKGLFTWELNRETSRFFAKGEETLRDLPTYRKTQHYDKYVKQYIQHTNPGFLAEAQKMITLAQDTLKIFIELAKVCQDTKTLSSSLPAKRKFLEEVSQHHKSYLEYAQFLMVNQKIIENSALEEPMLIFFETLQSNDDKLQKLMPIIM